MSEPLDPNATPLATVDPDSITALFDADPATQSDASFRALIAEIRRRTDVQRAEAAAAALAPKKAAKPRTRKGEIVAAAVAAIADKPVSELSVDDLFDGDVD